MRTQDLTLLVLSAWCMLGTPFPNRDGHHPTRMHLFRTGLFVEPQTLSFHRSTVAMFRGERPAAGASKADAPSSSRASVARHHAGIYACQFNRIPSNLPQPSSQCDRTQSIQPIEPHPIEPTFTTDFLRRDLLQGFSDSTFQAKRKAWSFGDEPGERSFV